jgi:hypothetical protein
MKPMTVNFLLMLAYVGGLVGHAQAQAVPPTTFDSIEWATVDSDAIVKGHVTSVDRSNGVTISFHADEILKGSVQQDIKFQAASGWPPRPGKRWDNKGSLLVFLVESRRIGALCFQMAAAHSRSIASHQGGLDPTGDSSRARAHLSRKNLVQS